MSVSANNSKYAQKSGNNSLVFVQKVLFPQEILPQSDGDKRSGDKGLSLISATSSVHSISKMQVLHFSLI